LAVYARKHTWLPVLYGKHWRNLRAQGMVDWLPKPPNLEQPAEVVTQALETKKED